MVNVRPELSGGPIPVRRFGDQAGEFADEVRKFGEFANMSPPRVEQTGANAGFAGVIENEPHFGATSDQLDYRRQNRMFAADIEIQAGRGEFADAADELRPGAVIGVLFVLEMMTDAADKWMLSKDSKVSGG